MQDTPPEEELVTARGYLQRGDIGAAHRLIELRLRLFPEDAETLQFAGTLALRVQDFDRALEYFNHALRTAAHNSLKAMCWHGIGQTYVGLKQPQLATEAFRHARLLDPAVLSYAYDLATALESTRQPLLAIETLRTAVTQHPRDPEVCVRLGNVLVQASRFNEALDLFQEALNRSANCASAYFNASIPLAILGETKQALAACDHALRLDPGLDAYYQLATLGGLDNDPQRLAFAERRTSGDGGVSIASRVDACFAVARAYDHAHDYQRAFEYLHRGNSLKRGTFEFSIADEARRIEAIIALFTPDFVSRFSGRVQSEMQPIFIVGMPRSGSTLLEQMLAGHPAITACGELDYMTDIAHEVGDQWWSNRPAGPGSDEEIIADLYRAADRYRCLVNARFKLTRRFTDKMLGNFLLLGLVHFMFPRGTLLRIRRDPMDTCFSCYEHLFTGYIPYAYDLVELGQYYLLYEKLMRHWHAVLPANRVLNVDYETLVKNPEPEIRRILAHCGLPFDTGCLQPERVQRPVNTASHSQVRKPVYRSSIGRWQHYAAYLGPLSEVLKIARA